MIKSLVYKHFEPILQALTLSLSLSLFRSLWLFFTTSRQVAARQTFAWKDSIFPLILLLHYTLNSLQLPSPLKGFLKRQ